MKWQRICYECGARRPIEDESAGGACAACGTPTSLLPPDNVAVDVLQARPCSMWHYAPLLPVHDMRHVVTLGEGATPLLDAPRLAGALKLGRVLIKNETANPTGSFKDRQVSVGISHARETGSETVAVVSSGNVACATSAYAARAGMKSVLLMHGHAAPHKVALAAAYGGRAVQVKSPSAAAVFDLCREACRQFGWYHLSTAGMYNAYNVEGAKTIAYELYQQTSGELPDWVVAPVGGGGLLGGIWRGFEDLRRLGLIKKAPRLAGIQATGCAPLVQAIKTGAKFLATLAHPWRDPHTVAGGIADDILFDGHTVLPAIRNTGGVALAVDDDAILDAQAYLATQEGLLCEPTSAVVIAALAQLPECGLDTRVCVVLTGTGFKDASHMQARTRPAAVIDADLEALAAAVS